MLNIISHLGSTNSNHNEIPLTHYKAQNAIIKTTGNNKCEETGSLIHADRNVK